ncbi:putative metal-binding motif-containing protein, partial [Candidatus Woesearchaeota archaeon]|nr:putative metal-binding motif-containing protein [Candidatus Woesearchaeota archaeon]
MKYNVLFGVLLSLLLVGTVSAVDIAYVVGDASILTSHEYSIKSILQNDMHFTVHLVDDDDLGALPQNDLLLIADSATDADVASLDVQGSPSLTMNGHFLYEQGWEQTPGFPNTYSGAYSTINRYFCPNHEIMTPYTMIYDIITTVQDPWGSYYNVMNIVVDDITGTRLANGDGGSDVVLGINTAPRRAFFGLQGAQYWNNNGRDVFIRTVNWILYGVSNSAPYLQPIADITVFEGELVTITALAADMENDPITYSINDSRFSQDDNIFTWQTQVGDNGVYSVTVGASDAYHTSSESVNINVIDIDNDNDGYDYTMDCDDNNASIYPGAPEIPYDGIDQDCDGAD